MKFLYPIRSVLASGKLRKLAEVKRDAVRFNYNQSKVIGVVYNADNGDETRAAIELYDRLKAEGKTVSTMGYLNINRKKTTLHPKLGYDYFYLSDLSFTLAPTNGIVDTFTNKNFDLLIDLTTTHVIPTDYIVALSKATMKAGHMRDSGTIFYDFMIGGVSNENIDTFAAQIIHYLKLLNN